MLSHLQFNSSHLHARVFLSIGNPVSIQSNHRKAVPNPHSTPNNYASTHTPPWLSNMAVRGSDIHAHVMQRGTYTISGWRNQCFYRKKSPVSFYMIPIPSTTFKNLDFNKKALTIFSLSFFVALYLKTKEGILHKALLARLLNQVQAMHTYTIYNKFLFN